MLSRLYGQTEQIKMKARTTATGHWAARERCYSYVSIWTCLPQREWRWMKMHKTKGNNIFCERRELIFCNIKQPHMAEEKHGYSHCSFQPRWALYPKKGDHISRKQGRKTFRSIEKNLDKQDAWWLFKPQVQGRKWSSNVNRQVCFLMQTEPLQTYES